jgi:hypothetical protein
MYSGLLQPRALQQRGYLVRFAGTGGAYSDGLRVRGWFPPQRMDFVPGQRSHGGGSCYIWELESCTLQASCRSRAARRGLTRRWNRPLTACSVSPVRGTSCYFLVPGLRRTPPGAVQLNVRPLVDNVPQVWSPNVRPSLAADGSCSSRRVDFTSATRDDALDSSPSTALL